MRPLVDFVVIGAMKCGTTSLHHYLGSHPRLGLAPEKEVNFFFGDDPTGAGNFWRGADWYASRFPPAPIRGEVSPGYTSPDHPEVAARLARLAPAARLVYMVRDPLDRAVSQYRHHRRDGAETRPLGEALLDRSGHYLRRSRYADRLEPFLRRFPPSQIAVVEHHDLLEHTEGTLSELCEFLGVDSAVPAGVADRRLNRAGSAPPDVAADVAARFRSLVADDVARFDSLRGELATVGPAGPARRGPSARRRCISGADDG